MVARQLNDELDPGSTIAMGDCAGSFAWFFEGRVIQLEGLMGDREMLEAIQAGDLERYVMDRAPDYLLSHTSPEGLVDYGIGGFCTPTEPSLRVCRTRSSSLRTTRSIDGSPPREPCPSGGCRRG